MLSNLFESTPFTEPTLLLTDTGFLRCRPRTMNHTLPVFCCCSLISSSSEFKNKNTYTTSATSLGPPWTSPLRFSSWNSEGARRKQLSGLSTTTLKPQYNSVVNSTTSSHDQLGLEAEKTRRQIFEDGFAVFPGMWSKAEVDDESMVLCGLGFRKVLESFLMDVVPMDVQRELVHTSAGHRCTDDATSPEPYWHHSWQIAGMEGEALQRPSWSATLVVSLSDRTANMFCGGVAVFPRSHWILNDRIANSTSSFPQPCDVPAAAPMELRLECGDMALLHPLLAYTIAPNVSSSSSRLLVFKLGDATSNQAKSRVDEGEQMWSGWHSIANSLTDRTTSVEEEMMQLQTEEGKAELGGWQDTMTGLPIGQVSLATSLSTRIAPRDLLAWRLRNSAVQFIQDGQWSNALSMLLRRAGLRPTCYWTALQAGRCCMKSAPAGQLGGRAGRKCTLEDGERFLLRAIEIAPGWPLAYAELMKCLALMGRGREQEIPGVMEMMKERCKLEQLCLRYPSSSGILQESWSNCEALCGERS